MAFQLPPIAKAAERLMLDIEQAVRAFPRYHRYASGARLREQALAVTYLTHRIWREHKDRRALVQELVQAIDMLKILLQLCCQLRAFSSFRQFESMFRLAYQLGRQAGGWRKHLDKHPTGQNAQGLNAMAQSAQELSARGASAAPWEVYR